MLFDEMSFLAQRMALEELSDAIQQKYPNGNNKRQVPLFEIVKMIEKRIDILGQAVETARKQRLGEDYDK